MAGALAGSLLLGFVEVGSVVIVGSGYRDALGFGLVLLILLTRPSGLFRRERDQAGMIAFFDAYHNVIDPLVC